MSKNNNHKMVKRFSKPVIVAHWLNAFAFFALLLTALPLYTDFFNWLYPVFGGPANARLLHRIFAIIFMLPTIFMILVDPKSFFHWIKQITTWKKHDIQFFAPFAKDFIGKHADVPKQDFYNAGEKLNSIVQILTTIMLIGSGIVMWGPDNFPKGLVLWAYPIHNIGVGLAATLVVGHIYLSIGHPNSKASLRGMIKGDVSLEYAEEHHGRWYDELIKQKKVVVQGKKDKKPKAPGNHGKNLGV